MTVQYKPGTESRGIEWTDRTVGPIGGCMHGCRWTMPDGTEAICYAEELAERGVAAPAYPKGFAHHYWRPNQLMAVSAGKEPELRFIDSMSDMFEANVPREHVLAVMAAMAKAPQHAFQSLTKAAPQVLKYLKELPPNLWVGVSSPPDHMLGKDLSRKQQAAMLTRSMDVLKEVRESTGNLVWMSAEPVSWDLCEILDATHPLDWVVIGAASSGRKYFQPEFSHIDRLIDLFDSTGTPVFYKGNIKPLINTAFEKTYHDNRWRWREDFPAQYRDGTIIRAVARRQEACAIRCWTKSNGAIPRHVRRSARIKQAELLP